MSEINVPEHLRILGAEAERLHDALDAALCRNDPVSAPACAPLMEATGVVAERLANDAAALADVFNGAIGEQARRGDGDVAAVYRAAGRLEQVLEHLIDTWRVARDIPVGPNEAYPHQLLVEGVRDVLDQVGDILARLAGMIAHPEAFDTGGEGTVRATLSATLDDPPAFQELAGWWRTHGLAIEAQQKRDGFWSTAGAVALGALLGGSLFGGNCN